MSLRGNQRRVQGGPRGIVLTGSCEQVGEQREPVRHTGKSSLRSEVANTLPGEGDARLAGARPALQPQAPFAVVREAMPIAQLTQLAGDIGELRLVVPHLAGNTAVGQSRGQAVRLVDGSGQLDRVVTAG